MLIRICSLSDRLRKWARANWGPGSAWKISGRESSSACSNARMQRAASALQPFFKQSKRGFCDGKERSPLGICLGHQILGQAAGGRTEKLKFGHRGINQPVKDLRSGMIEITSQNHGFVVVPESLSGLQEILQENLNDRTSEGIRYPEVHAFSVQYHPEAAPGPHEAGKLFDEFVRLMAERKAAR